MSTGYLELPALAWYPTNGAASNVAATLDFLTSTGAANPKARWARWAFDKDTDEHVACSFVMPGDYASAPVLKVKWYSARTSAETVQWGCKVLAITPGAAEDVPTKNYASTNVATATTCPANTNDLAETTITLTNADSVAAGDLVTLILYRDVSGDDAAGDAYMLGCEFQYTTN